MLAPYLIQYPWLLHVLCLGLLPLLFLLAGWAVGRWFHHPRRGCRVGLVLGLLFAGTYLYGSYVGSREFEVSRYELAFADLPPAFDGYRIVLFSDAHVGTLTGPRQQLLRQAVDSINAQRSDLVVFAGDLVNAHPDELLEHLPILRHIRTRDGIYAVLGNHDYGTYVLSADAPSASNSHDESLVQSSLRLALVNLQQDELHWRVLDNSHRVLHRGGDSIVIAGMENDGEGRFPQLGRIGRALLGVSRSDFVVMIEHDPTSWRRKILPECHAQLTLSGHTHGGQLSLFGAWSPAGLHYTEYDGTYAVGERRMVVSTGLSGVIPFRLGVTPEIVVITLRTKK